jgi:DNA polymerase III sliding clamp (beta) subunit (PCNA family)
VSQQDSRPVRQLPAIVTGSDIDLAFSPATLAPAIRSAVGPEIMLDISAPNQPVVVRSATDGDLTTLVMPTINPNTTEPQEHS